jgi:hypothetical protein
MFETIGGPKHQIHFFGALNGLDMSKKELEKLKNKLRLWMALNPTDNVCACHSCPLGKAPGRTRKPCPNLESAITLIGKPLHGGRTYIEDIVAMPWIEAKERFHKREMKRVGVIGCGEWIKYE